jgi:hypothetical protein
MRIEEIFNPTMELKWFVKSIVVEQKIKKEDIMHISQKDNIIGTLTSEKTLYQKWINGFGKVEWREIETELNKE